jgi:hypothetical protein
LEGNWRHPYAMVARAMAARGFAPGSYDDAEIWEVASALGAGEADDEPNVIENADPSEFIPPGWTPPR